MPVSAVNNGRSGHQLVRVHHTIEILECVELLAKVTDKIIVLPLLLYISGGLAVDHPHTFSLFRRLQMT